MTSKEDWDSEGVVGLATATSKATNSAVFAQEKQDLHEKVDALYAGLADLEDLIDRAARVLRLSQPPRLIGKVDIRWWIKSGKRYRDPVLVRWLKSRIGKLRPVVVPRFDGVWDKPGFKVNEDQTVEAVKLIKTYEKRRQAIRERILRIKRMTAQVDDVYRIIDNDRVVLEMMMATVGNNLIKAGYDIDVKVMREMGLLDDESPA